jgi:GTP-binding protein LepA
LVPSEGILQLIDDSLDIEAQTIAFGDLIMAQGLVIISILIKIEYPGADVERVLAQSKDIKAIPCEETIMTSAKAFIGKNHH